jgi:hypothetical protein
MNGTLVGTAPALLEELLAALEALEEEDEPEADAADAALEVTLAPTLAAELLAFEAVAAAALLAELAFDMPLMPEVMDWAAARPAKRRVIEKRMLVFGYCFR